MIGQSLTYPASLSVHRAFVVEFSADADVQAGRVRGRVEHVVSGRATSFQSQEMLLAFMAQVLRESNQNLPGKPENSHMIRLKRL